MKTTCLFVVTGGIAFSVPQIFGQKAKDEAPKFFEQRPSAAEFYGIQKDQKTVEPQFDKRNIRHSGAMLSDTSNDFITIPADYPEVKDFVVAHTAPTIEFSIIQGLEPWYLPALPSMDQRPIESSAGFAIWSGFNDVTLGPDGCFYFAIGNHLYHGGKAYVIRYDPVKKTQRVVLDSQKVAGWKATDWTDGKIHGDLDVDADGNMWMLTFSGPRPLEKDLASVSYQGGHLLRYNIYSAEKEDLGVPFAGDTWCYHALDKKEGILFGVGQARNSIMVYDTRARRLIYGGFPPNGITWFRRAILVDEETGKIYSTNSTASEDGPNNLICYERRNNEITVLKSRPPIHPAYGKNFPLRAYTKKKTADGAFWCFCDSGTMFKFYPAKDLIEYLGLNWGKRGYYTTNLCLSPKERYLYYLPGSHSEAYKFGTPVVQFDTKTNQKKVIAFLNDFYLTKYGYSPYGSYGLELTEDGESLIFYTNGVFTNKERGSGYGRPAIFQLHIPAAERIE